MKHSCAGILIMSLTLAAATAQQTENKPASLESELQKRSYAIGVNMGSSLVRQEVEIDLDALVAGFSHAFQGSDKLLTEEQNEALIREVQQEIRERQMAKQRAEQEKRQAQGETNKVEGPKFLAANKEQPGVKATDSGLQYKILTHGTGEKPNREDTVVVNYRGRLIDGTEFDSSYKRGQPAKFKANQVIKGWTEALQMMPVGSKWELYIPSALAYGERGQGSDIPPHSVLIFEVELLDIERAKPAEPVTSDIIKVPSAEELKKGAQIEIIKKDEIEEYKKREAEKKANPESDN